MAEQTLTAPPPPEEFLLSTPLYAEFLAGEGFAKEVLAIRNPPYTVDCHCFKCNKESIYNLEESSGAIVNGDLLLKQNPKLIVKSIYFTITYECNRCKLHALRFHVMIRRERIQKIGQIPSLADLQLTEVRKYRSVLGDERYVEFTRAIGLAAHGIGIGSFVYLRRIFESLVEEAHELAKKDAGWDEAEYAKKRMGEKIDALKHHLPQFLIDTKKIYPVLSKGIHELAEKECLAYFDAIRVGIELILEEKLEELEKDKKINRAKVAIAKLPVS